MAEEDDDIFGDEGKTSEGFDLTGIVKDIALTGLATVFMTEDSVRKYLKELKVPKELIGTALESAGKKKDDLYRVLSSEVAKMLANVDVVKEAGRFLETHKVNVNATFTFERKDKPDPEEGDS